MGFGSCEEDNGSGSSLEPVYYEFKTLDELSDFYMKAMNYISTCLAKG